MVAELTRIPRNNVTRLDRAIARRENEEAWGRVIHLGSRIQTAIVAERDDVIQQAGAELVHLGQRRLRQMDGGDAA